MAKQVKEINIKLGSEQQHFNVLLAPLIPFKPFGIAKDSKKQESIHINELRQLLNKEKARILITLKNKKPGSIYELSKILDRDFKSVLQDVRLLEKFGFITLNKETLKNKKTLKPVLVIDKINIGIEI